MPKPRDVPPGELDASERAQEKSRVLVVDDDEALLRSVRLVLVRAGHEVETYSSPKALLESARLTPPCCLLLDVEMPSRSGLELQAELVRMGEAVPIVFMTAHEDVRRSVTAMKAGAVDFLIKPFENQDLLAAVRAALARSASESAQRDAVADAQRRLRRLSPREREVCVLVARGLTSKKIAESLGTAEKTVKVHRSRVMAKLEVGSVAELVRLVQLTRTDPG